MASKIPKRNSLKVPSPLTDDEKLKALNTRTETGAKPKLIRQPKLMLDKTRATTIPESKASSSSQIEKKVNSRAAHSGMVLKLNSKKVTIVEPFNPRKNQENEAELVRSNSLKKISTPLCRSFSFSEKSGKHQEATTQANAISKSKKPLIDKNFVKSTAKSSTSGTKPSDDKSKKLNRSKTELAIKLDKTAATKDEIKSTTEKTEPNPLILEEFLSPHFIGVVGGKISPGSLRKNVIGHSGLKFVPKARKKSLFKLNTKREETTPESEHKIAKSE